MRSLERNGKYQSNQNTKLKTICSLQKKILKIHTQVHELGVQHQHPFLIRLNWSNSANHNKATDRRNKPGNSLKTLKNNQSHLLSTDHVHKPDAASGQNMSMTPPSLLALVKLARLWKNHVTLSLSNSSSVIVVSCSRHNSPGCVVCATIPIELCMGKNELMV